MKKKIIILGAGESGVGAAILARKEGFSVFVSDMGAIKDEYKIVLQEKNIDFEEKTHEKAMEVINNTGTVETRRATSLQIEVIKSPGIPDKAPIIQVIKEKNIPIISEIEFAGRYTKAKTICITGSNGKTTTTMLTYHILKEAGLNVGLAGNVGKSLAWQVAEENYDYYVIELSSFQLDNMYDFKADVAIILNITPDHLDRYNYDFKQYADAKFRILQNQTKDDCFIYWAGDPVINGKLTIENGKWENTESEIQLSTFNFPLSTKLLPFNIDKEKNNIAYIENNTLIMNTENQFTMPINELALKGTHNAYNSMAAALAASVMQIKNDDIRRSLSNFAGVEHRLEYVASVRGITFINDSKATNVNSCWYALQSMTTPVVLILGGTDKGNDYSEIESLVSEKVHTLVFLGKDNSKLQAFFAGKVPNIIETESMEEAVKKSYVAANKGEAVLLSPCCASFDLFENYEDRGRKFKEEVRKL
jgi:UDP-N-acetylmuramoylalanine--D-glutamate ligase